MNKIRQEYIDGFNDLRKMLEANEHLQYRYVEIFVDFAMEFCEKHNLHEDFVRCKLDPFALYAVYKCDGDTEKLKRYVKASNKLREEKENKFKKLE